MLSFVSLDRLSLHSPRTMYVSELNARLRAMRWCVGFLLAFGMLSAPDNTAAQPRPSDTFNRLSRMAQKASAENRLDDASRLYKKALAIRPTWADGWWSLGTLEYDQNHYTKAGGDFKQVIKLQPAN